MTYIDIFKKQQEYKIELRKSVASERIQKLRRLERRFLAYRSRFKDALHKDLRKNHIEADLTEISSVLTEIRHIRKRLRYWMSDKKVPNPIILTGTSSKIKYEPKGSVLIIAPWNYPVNLSLVPLIGAVAAGNTVMLKPSELAPNVAGVLNEFIREVFDSKEVAVVEGDAIFSNKLLDLPFDHIFFTGSSRVGKIVMEKASKNLSSITLELGGKCPVIIDKGINIKKVVHRILWAQNYIYHH